MKQEALNRDQSCIFSGRMPSGDSDTLIATWIFPPFLGYEVCSYCTMSSYSVLIVPLSLSLHSSAVGRPMATEQILRGSWYMRSKQIDGGDKCRIMSSRCFFFSALFYDNMFGVDVDVSIHDFHIIYYYIMDWYPLTCRTIIIVSLCLRVQNVYKVVCRWKVISSSSMDLFGPVTSFSVCTLRGQCVSRWRHGRLWGARDWEFHGRTRCLRRRDGYCRS